MFCHDSVSIYPFFTMLARTSSASLLPNSLQPSHSTAFSDERYPSPSTSCSSGGFAHHNLVHFQFSGLSNTVTSQAHSSAPVLPANSCRFDYSLLAACSQGLAKPNECFGFRRREYGFRNRYFRVSSWPDLSAGSQDLININASVGSRPIAAQALDKEIGSDYGGFALSSWPGTSSCSCQGHGKINSSVSFKPSGTEVLPIENSKIFRVSSLPAVWFPSKTGETFHCIDEGTGDGNGNDGFRGDNGEGGGDSGDPDFRDLYYQKLLQQYPGDALFLRNYALFLEEFKHDVQKAEKFYERAILANPDDGEILARYANMVWNEHGDYERASDYFERAIQASPQDSLVLATYASFLWSSDKPEDQKTGSYARTF